MLTDNVHKHYDCIILFLPPNLFTLSVITEKNNCFINLLYGCGTYKGIYIIQHILHIMLLYTEAPPIDYPIHVDEIMFTNFRKQYFHEFIVA